MDKKKPQKKYILLPYLVYDVINGVQQPVQEVKPREVKKRK